MALNASDATAISITDWMQCRNELDSDVDLGSNAEFNLQSCRPCAQLISGTVSSTRNIRRASPRGLRLLDPGRWVLLVSSGLPVNRVLLEVGIYGAAYRRIEVGGAETFE